MIIQWLDPEDGQWKPLSHAQPIRNAIGIKLTGELPRRMWVLNEPGDFKPLTDNGQK